MYIGVPKEQKDGEGRVGLTPSAVKQLVGLGHPVCIESDAGALSGFTNEAYAHAGATVHWSTRSVYQYADMIVKVKELTPPEHQYLEYCEGKIIATYWHLAGESELTKALLKHRVSAWAYECVERMVGNIVTHPLLDPMSVIAGREAARAALAYRIMQQRAETPHTAVIVGGGTVGQASLEELLVHGRVNVTLFEKDPVHCAELAQKYAGRATISLMTDDRSSYVNALSQANIIVLAVMVRGGAHAPIVITQDDLTHIQSGCYIADVAIDQGGSSAASHPTKPKEIFEYNGIIFSCPQNIPGLTVPREATESLGSATLPYLTEIAQKGLWRAMDDSRGIYRGLQTFNGWLLNKHVADEHGLQSYYRSFDQIFFP